MDGLIAKSCCLHLLRIFFSDIGWTGTTYRRVGIINTFGIKIKQVNRQESATFNGSKWLLVALRSLCLCLALSHPRLLKAVEYLSGRISQPMMGSAERIHLDLEIRMLFD